MVLYSTTVDGNQGLDSIMGQVTSFDLDNMAVVAVLATSRSITDALVTIVIRVPE